MDNDDATKSPFNAYDTTHESSHADDVSDPPNIDNAHIDHENTDDDGDDDVTNNIEEEEDDDDGEDADDDVTNNIENDDDDDDDEGGNGVQRIGKDNHIYNDIDGVDDDEDEDDDGDSQRHQKKRKLKTLLSSYEFAPRVPTQSPSAAQKPSPGGRNPLTDWTEPETFVLLNAWGERFLNQGRKSLRSEQWQEVAEKVNKESRNIRTETQCRNRLDTLKKKYKKDKMKFGDGNNKSASSNWVYFKKMDSLLSATKPKEQGLLSCAVDSGEYVSTNPKANLNRSNDSPEDVSEGLPPKRLKSNKRTANKSMSSFKLLADSINRFSEVYEKLEKGSKRQLAEFEKMRIEFSRDLEMQKKQIMERAQAEIEKIRRGMYEEDEVCGKNH